MRHHLCRVYGGVDHHPAGALPTNYLQFIGGGAQHIAHVPRVLHLQHAADSAARVTHWLDLSNHSDRREGNQVGTDGR